MASSRAVVNGHISKYVVKIVIYRKKIDGWMNRYAKKLKLGVSVCHKNALACSVGISQCIGWKSLIFEI